MQLSLVILAIFAAAARDVNGLKLTVDYSTLGKRQATDACLSECNSYTDLTTQCASQATTGGYARCICSNSVVQAVAQCTNCGISASTDQTDINTIENAVNAYISACAELGFPISSLSVTAQPTVSFPCTLALNTGGSTARTTASPATVTVTTGAATAFATSAAADPFSVSVDPAELSLISSLLGTSIAP